MAHQSQRAQPVVKFVDAKHVAARYGVSRATAWRWVRAGALPAPIRLSGGATRWRLSDLEAFEQRLDAGK